jgi:cobalt-zinc-cadmium resistance protein CzcA
MKPLIIIIISIIFTNAVNAQDTILTLQSAIEISLKNYPAIKASQLNIEKQKAVKPTAFDLGTTSVYTGKEEYGNGAKGIDNRLGIEQNDIDIFSVPIKYKLNKNKENLANAEKSLTEKQLVKKVSIAWFNVLYTLKMNELYKELDSLYTNFKKAAELRYKTQSTSKIEYISANAKYKQLQIDIKIWENEYKNSLQELNQYVMFNGTIAIAQEDLKNYINTNIPDSIINNAQLNVLSYNVELSKSEWKAKKSEFLPKINLAYKFQNIDGISGYNAWQAGISLPLLFFSKSAETKTKRFDYEIAKQNLEQKKLEINTEYKKLINKYKIYSELINYYKNEAVPLANEQIKASGFAYKLGDISYVQFIQNIENAIMIKKDFLARQKEFLEIITEIKYLNHSAL